MCWASGCSAHPCVFRCAARHHGRAHLLTSACCPACRALMRARRDYVKKIAVYKDKLAVQLPSKIVIYELAQGQDDYDMHYTVRPAMAWHGVAGAGGRTNGPSLPCLEEWRGATNPFKSVMPAWRAAV